jgi:recombination protein RecT
VNQIAPISIIRANLEHEVPDIARMLPPDVDPERFKAVVITAIQTNPDLSDCDRDSLWVACRKAAQDGLLPDGREGAIIARWNNKAGCQLATWQPMTFGILKKAKQKGAVSAIRAVVVYEGEKFEVYEGDEDRIVHVRDVDAPGNAKPRAVYAIATLKDGNREREVMSWAQIEQVRASSTSPKKGPWVTWTEEMARKTVLRRLAKRLPSLDDDTRRVIERVDDLYDFGKPAEAAPALPPAQEQQPEAPPPPAPPKPAEWVIVSSKDGTPATFATGEEWLSAWQHRIRSVENAKRGMPEDKVRKLGEMWRANADVFDRLPADAVEEVQRAMEAAQMRLTPPQQEEEAGGWLPGDP